MSTYYDAELVSSLAMGDTCLVDLGEYGDLVERDGPFGAHGLQAIADGAYDDLTPKMNQDVPQGDAQFEMAPHDGDKFSAAGDAYDVNMSTPPLSPSTTISSLQTDAYSANGYSRSQDSFAHHEEREDIRRGKQREAPPAETAMEDDLAAQEDSDWYGMQYAMERSRVDRQDAAAKWPPTAGEPSTSDAAFVAMYDGYIYPQDVEYWYAHWCKWHRALAREERRRRDRASSDAEHTRAYHHATYVQWERAQRKKYTQQASGNAVGSKPMTNSRGRHRSSTCLF